MSTLRDLLSQYPTLYAAAAEAPGTRPVAGRGTAYAMNTSSGMWLVRHYRRGGALAGLLSDRYPRFGAGRALRELRVSAGARAAGIPTPEVIAAVTYTSGVFTRHDLAVVWIDGAADLADILFGETRQDRDHAVGEAASLIEAICRRGLRHADLNLKNILVAPDRAYIVDLDRCTMSKRASARYATTMRNRFVRSLEKWQRQTGRVVSAAHQRTLVEAFRVD